MGCIRPGHRRRPGFFNIFHRFIHISAKIGGFPGGFWGKTGDRFPLQGGRGVYARSNGRSRAPAASRRTGLPCAGWRGGRCSPPEPACGDGWGWGKGHRGVARLPLEGGEHPIVDPVKDLALVEELHLSLGRVDVHIHLAGLHLELEHAAGKLAHHFLVLIGPLQGGHEKLGLHRPAIDEKNAGRSGCPGSRRAGRQSR